MTTTDSPQSFTFTIQTPDFRSLPIPGVENSAKVGDCYVKVTDLPEQLDDFMEVNPRVPKRTQKGILSGPVIKGIFETLRESPEDMAIKNQGIYLLVDDSEYKRRSGGVGNLTVTLSDPNRHGIVNGGHTYAAIRDAIEQADESENDNLSRAFVRLHVLQGIDEAKLADIAEGLNRSKQVDDPSLANLRGAFRKIQEVMKGNPGEHAIAYSQGADGDVYISEVLVYLQLFNRERYDDDKHPYALYRRQKQGLDFFEQDLAKEERGEPSAAGLLILHLPEILGLADEVRYRTPSAAKEVGFQFGRMKIGTKRAASKKNRNTPLPFISKTMDHRVPKGWLFPMLAAFRANVRWDLETGLFEWKIPLEQIVPEVMPDLAEVCVSEHRDNNMRPEWVGKRVSAYRQCYDKVQLYLARRGKLG